MRTRSLSRSLTLAAICATALIAATLPAIAVGGTANAPGAARPMNPRAREKWFFGQRAYPSGAIPAGALVQAQGQAEMASSRSGLSSAAVSSWSSLGPRPIPAGQPSIYNGAPPWSGRVTAIAHNPANAMVAYLGAADGGVWKTSDSGAHWTATFDAQPSLAIGAIAVDPANPSTVYVGTGEPNDPSGFSGSDQYFGAGIFKSTDGGSSWTKVGGSAFDNCYVSAVMVQPGSSSTVLAGVGNLGRYATSCPNGIYRSVNGGSTWTRKLTGPVSDLVSKPGTPTTWYAAFRGFGIWKSTDAGVTWNQLGGGLPTADLGRVVLGVTAANPARVYAAIGQASTGAALGVWTSGNSGGSWTQLPYTNFCGYTNNAPTGQCDYDLSAAAYPANQNYFYVGGIRLQRWDGTSWTTLGYDGVNTTGFHVDIHSVTFDSQKRLWVGSDGGAYRKDGGTAGFANLNATLAITQFYPGISGTATGTLLGGTQDNGSLQHTSGGWYELETGDGGYTALDTVHSYKFTTYVNATVTRDPGGTCLFTASSEPQVQAGCTTVVGDPSLFIAPLVQSPSNAATLYVGTNRIWKSSNDGTNWSAVSPAYSGYLTSAIAQAKSNANVLYGAWSQIAKNQAGAVFVGVSTDGGNTWSGTGALPNRFLTDLTVKTTAPNVAWVTLSGYNTGHVFLTQNYGATWKNISGNLPNAPVNAIEVDPRTSPTTLYAATDVGVFDSTNGGTTWTNISTGLPHSVIADIHLDPATNTLIAATHGRGIFTARIT